MDLSKLSEPLLKAYFDSLSKQHKPSLLNENTTKKTVFLDIDIQQSFVDEKQIPVDSQLWPLDIRQSFIDPQFWPRHAHKNEDIDFNKEVL